MQNRGDKALPCYMPHLIASCGNSFEFVIIEILVILMVEFRLSEFFSNLIQQFV